MILKDKDGLTLLQIIITITIMLALTAIAARSGLVFLDSEKKSEVVSDITQLESVVKSYYLVNNTYPAKYAVNIDDPQSGLDFNGVFKAIKSSVALTDTQIQERFKPLDLDLLKDGKYIVNTSSKEDFIIDVLEGHIYYAKQFANMTTPEFNTVKLSIEKSSGLNLKLQNVGNVALSNNGASMTKVNANISVGNKVILGGDGTMYLAEVQTNSINGGYTTKVVNISNKLTGSNVSVGDFKYLGDNKVLVHYTDNGVLSYTTIIID